MFKYLKEYVDFSVRVNDYISTIMLDNEISCESYNYSRIWKLMQSQGAVIRGFQFNDIASEQIAGLLIQDPLETTIGFNRELDEKSKNFIISHEITHYLFHMDKQNQLFYDTVRDIRSCEHKQLQEFQANIGASIILVPDRVLFYSLKKGWDLSQISDSFGISEDHLVMRLIQMMQANLGLSFRTAKKHTDLFCGTGRVTSVQLATKLEYQIERPNYFTEIV
ncbi:hypothetical protein UAY_03276 [Enterococcus moraviensis ATCC BAA-383]|uniref:IrrE N-terminal-like domain-containing protein n=1 Tax=Enterococcus moraviensis ATCC BAA-383 TaxID=1158609 RepID=R2SL05_9ENTE|nr:ImmA/IrrE family metallo-endopeptidase [Enterococcus moraviensis]EOH95850.1 hypothetical protein UAY_03276 [Enterococcus moraviensis ATCC BAA-383]EOT66337.1 hypothetical protein I586_02608 [Enterococcus moraviensis ATCC BAA-383]OJG67601.1 hypothetical protein RV09_GL002370 [Enterococcus moraviensis]